MVKEKGKGKYGKGKGKGKGKYGKGKGKHMMDNDEYGTTPGAHKAHCAKGNYPLYVPGKTVVPVGGRVMFKNGACAQKGKDGRFKIFKGLSKEELAKLRKKRGKK